MKIGKLVGVPLGLAGASVGMGLVGEALGSEGLQQGGVAAGKFIAPAVTISAGGYLINQLKQINQNPKQEKEKSKQRRLL